MSVPLSQTQLGKRELIFAHRAGVEGWSINGGNCCDQSRGDCHLLTQLWELQLQVGKGLCKGKAFQASRPCMVLNLRVEY